MTGEREPAGCLTGVVRAVALVVVVPVRFVWELLVLVLRPVGVAVGWVQRMIGLALYGVFVWPLVMVWRYVLAPVGRVLIVVPLRWLYRVVLAPIGRAALVAAAWLFRYLVLVPLRALSEYVLVPVGRALVWLVRYLVVIPTVWLVRYLLVIPLAWIWRTALYPVLRELGRAIAWAWHLGGRVWRFVVVRPCRWVRREVWWPVKAEVRRVLREVRRALFG